MPQPRTLAQKIWESHLARREQGAPDLLYVDLHLVHEVTSAQAFEGLRLNGRRVRRPDLTIAVPDHDVPTDNRTEPFAEPPRATTGGSAPFQLPRLRRPPH